MALHGNIAVMKRLMTMYSDSLTLRCVHNLLSCHHTIAKHRTINTSFPTEVINHMHEYLVITCIPHAQCVGRKAHLFISESFILVDSCVLFKVQPDIKSHG